MNKLFAANPCKKNTLKSMLILALCGAFFDGYAQLERPYVPPSPNASGIVRRANIAVGHYTGVPNISIPLGALGGKGVSVPVSIDYHASGIKVQDMAGSTGLGWTLNAGGAITRVVRGLPDGLKPNCINGTSSYYSSINENCDGERDVFYFSIMGRSGKMFLDSDGNPQTMPYQDLRIEPGVGPLSIGYWTIIDENGYKYIFGETSAAREETTYYVGDTSYDEKYTYISTWYLNKVVAPTGQVNAAGHEVATFTYAAGNDVEYLMYYQIGIEPSDGPLAMTTINTKIKVNAPKYLSWIKTAQGSVNFDYLENRFDLINGWQISAITLRDGDGISRRKFHFSLDYFSGEFGSPYNRLRLSSIKEGVENPVLAYSFSYFEAPIIGGFSMNPRRESYYCDYFGYYNRSNNGQCQPLSRLPVGCALQGITKWPSYEVEERQTFSLKEISNSNGGKVAFVYENSSRGIRIGSISNYSGTDLITKSTFTYSGAHGFSMPVFSYTAHDGSTIWASSSFKDLFDLNGINIGYSTVTETFLDGSKIIREFTDSSDFPDTPPTVGEYFANPPPSTPQYQGARNVNGPPFAPSTSKFYMRGLPESVRIYDSQNNCLLTEEMHYKEGPIVASISNTALHNYHQTWGPDPTITYISGSYVLNSCPVELDYKRTVLYDQSNFASFLAKRTDFEYHDTYRTFPTSMVSFIEGGGPQQKVAFKYAIDLTGSCAEGGTCSIASGADELTKGVWALATKHVITPIEKLSYLKDWGQTAFNITGGQLYTFKEGTPYGQPVPKAVYGLELATPAASLDTETSLTSNGTVYSYDNNHFRVIKEFTYNEGENVLIKSTDNQGIVNSLEYGYDYSLVTATSVLLDGNPKYRSQYAYNTIYGLTGVTDMNGIHTGYEYDRFGRLKLVKDDDDNIVTRYRYNTLNTNEFSASFSKDIANPIAYQSVHFSAAGSPETSGITHYLWDFGDGVVTEEPTGNISHTYTSSGTFTVKLSKVNAEYGTVMGTSQVNIYPELSVDVQTSCSSVDLCVTTGGCLFTATGSGGCPGEKTYSWLLSTDYGSSWSSVPGLAGQMLFDFNAEGQHLFKCQIIDACGNISESDYSIVLVYRSNPGCN